MRDRIWSWNLAGTAISGGRALSGVHPFGRFDGGGYWVATMQDVQVSSSDNIRAWRALRTLLDGGVTAMAVEARDVYAAPWPIVGGAPLISADTATDDDVTLDDGSLLAGNVISATLGADAALRATTVQINFASAGSTTNGLRGGERFSIQHTTYLDRLYEIGTVSSLGSGNYSVTIRPPIREAVSAGATCEFDYPRCIMRLADPAAMDLAQQRRLYAQASVKWVESFPPFAT